MAKKKCIFAVGPDEVGSIKYLEEFACVCTKPSVKIIENELYCLIDKEKRKIYSEKAFNYALENHSKKYVDKTLEEIFHD